METKRQTVKTQRELAKALDISRQHLVRWMKRPNFPQKTERGWSVAACLQFLLQARREAADQVGRGNGTQASQGTLTALQKAREQKIRREIATMDLKLARLRGEQIPVEEVQAALTFLASQFSAALDNLLNRVGNECKATPAAVESIRRAIASTRRDLEGWIRNAADTGVMCGDNGAAAADDDLAVARG